MKNLLKSTLAISILLTLPIYANESEENTITEYIGKITNVYMGKSNEVKIGLELNEDEDLDCINADWPLYFNSDTNYASNWLDFVLLVNRTRDIVRIGYTPNTDSNCEIEYLAIMDQDGVLGADTDSITGDPSLTRTGEYGNIALINSNGLRSINYSSSHTYNADIAAAAFDGHILNENINDDSDELINRGIWLIKKDPDDTSAEYWLQAEFNALVKITSFRIMLNQRSVQMDRLPKEITIQVSNDGIDFIDFDAFKLNKAEDQRALLASPIELKYFRLLINSNYGDNFIEIDELELFAD